MNWSSLLVPASILATRFPLEKIFIHRDKAKALEGFAATLPRTNPQSSPPTEKAPEIVPQSPIVAPPPTATTETKSEKITQEEVTNYQNREMGKKLLLIEGHLNQGVKIAGKACDCISPKHSTELEALAEESISINPQQAQLYKELADFGRELNYKAREDIVASGQYENEYPQLAAKARGFRKELLGTEILSAMIAPEKQFSLEEAKAEASRMAAEEVEKQWQSTGKT